MSSEAELLTDSAEDLFEDAPCGYLSTGLDGTIIRVNRTFETWTGRSRAELVGRLRLQDLLSPGGRIYHETHYAPLLLMQGSVREIAVEIVRADGTLLPALINSTLRLDEANQPWVIATTIFDATDRRRYEQELLRGQERERDIAQQLQRSLLWGEPPQSPRLELMTHYSPGVKGTQAGGDWHDAFWVDGEQTVGLVVGDVVGRGIAAAATMGQLRSAVRALASVGLGPAELLTALDRYSRRYDVGYMATLVYAQLGLDTGLLCFACAGHPPPLIREPGVAAHFDWDGRSMPLAAGIEGEPRPQTSSTLARGGAVLLYTDGLIESRERPGEDGMAHLQKEVEDRHGATLTQLVRAIVDQLREPHLPDDVCLLAARVVPQRAGA
jgi:sigma-B regulation protein RsbU (phosphoserine phosphatase)